MVRAHNAEFLHWLDHALGWLLHGYPVLALKHLIRAFQKLYQDWLCSRRADSVLAITQWEIDNYWSYLTSPKKIFYVPYHSPAKVIDSPAVNFVTRENILICMLAKNVSSSSLLIDAREKFVSLVKKIGARLPEWRFVITGPINGVQVVESRIERMGFVDDIGHILQRAKAVAVLSNLGFGFKTKIIEAIEFGCIVLVQDVLYKRLPDELRSSCMIVDISDISSITNALNNINLYQDFSGNGVIMNNKLKIQMYSKLDEFFISYGNIN
jgi:glycosyltransferase involved in cell wall biosynthesis